MRQKMMFKPPSFYSSEEFSILNEAENDV